MLWRSEAGLCLTLCVGGFLAVWPRGRLRLTVQFALCVLFRECRCTTMSTRARTISAT